MCPSRCTPRVLLAAIVGTTLLQWQTTPVHAAKYWKNSVVNGNWSTGSKWSIVSAAGGDVGGVPIAGDDVFVSPTTDSNRTITFDVTPAATFNSLTVNSSPHTGGNTTTLSMAANSLSATTESIGNSGAGSNGIATLMQSGGLNIVGAGNL
jgi:hypothetical protein